MSEINPCDSCLRHAYAVAMLGAHIDIEWKRARSISGLLGLETGELLKFDPTGRVARQLRMFDFDESRAELRRTHIGALCRCDDHYPAALTNLPDPPRTLFFRGRAELLAIDQPAVAIVGARAATEYGLVIARGLGQQLAAARVTIVSGMALGVDSAAHEGALASRGPTIAVLAGCVGRPYPASKRALYEQIIGHGLVIGEMPPGTRVHRWAFIARNRLIAALGQVTIVVEAKAKSGALSTADFAGDIGRTVAVIPGEITSPQSEGPHALLAAGASPIFRAQDVLDLLFDQGSMPSQITVRPPHHLMPVFQQVSAGLTSLSALELELGCAAQVGAHLAELELGGFIVREFGGRYRAAL